MVSRKRAVLQHSINQKWENEGLITVGVYIEVGVVEVVPNHVYDEWQQLRPIYICIGDTVEPMF